MVTSAFVLLALSVVLLFSALLAASEAAVRSIGEPRLRTLTAEGFEGAEELLALRASRARGEGVLDLVGIILKLSGAALGVAWGFMRWGGASWAVVAIATIGLFVVACEILPRALAHRWPIRIGLLTAPYLLRLEFGLSFLLSPVLRLERALVGGPDDAETSPEEREVREIAELGREEGIVDAEEHLLVERAFRFDELTAWDVMVPRVDIFAWKDDLRLKEIMGEIKIVPYSRVPVYGSTIDDVTGILYIREAYEAYAAGRHDVLLSAISRDPFFVPGSLSLTLLLRDFQTRHIHLGIVADEFGGTDGLVTLEDVLEELVGEIVDETDIAEEPLLRIAKDELVADGGVDLREINYAFNVSLPQLEHRSLNGFILDELGYVPQGGESMHRDGVQIDILEATETQVVRARLRRVAPSKADDYEEHG